KSLENNFAPVLPFDEDASFIQKSLMPFGFETICWIKRGEYLSLKKIMIVKHTAPTGNYNEEFIQQIRKLFRNHFNKGGSRGSKIYVSRIKSKRRRVINEQEVSDLLSSYGFVTIVFEDYSFEEQIRISANAQLLIGIHGAGLTNMMFMQEQSSVLEFRPANDATNLCYYSLASALELHYYYQFGQGLKETQTIHDDLHINLDMLRENVEDMLSRYK
ncbi:MAG: glycosyltransferase family 61 protein, partial [Bacteroidia bacterium]